MIFLLVLPAALSALTLAAHFLRNGHLALTAAAAAVPLLLFVRRRWVVRYTQILLAIGTLEWSRSAGALLYERLNEGRPYGRMLAIMYGVGAFTVISALLLRTARVRHRYAPAGVSESPPTGTSPARSG